MASTSGDISTLVFKRNISLARENYALDFKMLRVLGEIEGTRDVATIAASLDTDIPDVKAACARLFQQQLILPAHLRTTFHSEANQNSSPQAPGAEFTGGILDPIPDDAYEIEGDEKTSAESFSETLLPAQEENLPRLERSAALSEPNAETNGGQTEKVDKPWEDLEKSGNEDAWNWPDRSPAGLDSANEDTTGWGAGSTRFGDSDRIGPVSSSTSPAYDSSTDIFSITRAGDRDAINSRSNAFASMPGSKPANPAAGRLMPEVWQADESIREEASCPKVNTEAIEHFEEGLALLQRSAFKEALRQFEMAMELDPQNRLCRANIQRIRNKLAPDEE